MQSSMAYMDTICAPISGFGPSAVALLRISGPQTRAILERLLPDSDKVLSAPHKLVYTGIYDLLVEAKPGEEKALLDHCLVVFFAGPRSYTGEDSAEINIHASPYIQRRLIEGLSSAGVRPARAGEFSERAYCNGRMDLVQAEAVADLIAAESEVQARIAREQLEGRLSDAITELGEPLRDLLAEIEAYIDFPEEGIESRTYSSWAAGAQGVSQRITHYLSTFRTGKLYREGALVALAGFPNAGKSSLLNCLLGENRVIVAELPGTTRDSIEERITIDGLFVRLCDTAGLYGREAGGPSDIVEQQGVERSWQIAKKADLILFVHDASRPIDGDTKALFSEIEEHSPVIQIVLNKCDLIDFNQKEALLAQLKELGGSPALAVSALQNSGIEELRSCIHGSLLGESSSTESVMICSQRHYDCFAEAHKALLRGIELLKAKREIELISLELRAALGALSDIVGVTETEDILGRIFSRFCIGK